MSVLQDEDCNFVVKFMIALQGKRSTATPDPTHRRPKPIKSKLAATQTEI